MKLSLRYRSPYLMVLTLLLLLAVGSGDAVAGTAPAPLRQSLSGEEALKFLHENRLYERLAGELPPAGRPFFEVDKLVADDGQAGDVGALAVALDGDTALVGAPGAGVGGNAG